MSIKTFPERPGKDLDLLALFIILSVVLHIGMVLGLFSFGNLSSAVLKRISDKAAEPVVVDVVELPPGAPDSSVPKKPPTHFADRTQSVDKETYPEPTPRPRRALPGAAGGGGAKAPDSTLKGDKGAGRAAQPPVAPTDTKKESVRKNEQLAPPASRSTKVEPRPAEKTPPDTKQTAKAPVEETLLPPAKTPKKAETPVEDAGKGSARDGAKGKNPRPNLFLPDERISELEKKYEAEAPKGERGKTLQLNTSEILYQKYLMNMKRKIEFYWEYPELAARNGWQGSLRIDFSINKDGTLNYVKVVKSSNYPVLDDAAVTALRLAAPFPPFPDNFSIEELSIRGSFEYDIYRPPGR